MASDYGLNFGFRRSDESLRVSEGRVRTPADGDPLLLGTCVEIDPENPGYLRAAAANAKPRTGICGLLVQEEVWDRSIYDTVILDSFSLGVAYKNRLSVITNGPGSKVWFKNTPAQQRADGRDVPPVTIFATAGIEVGAKLGWDGTRWAVTADEANAHMEVTFWNADQAFLEATLLK
jgi:hypothetical protein